MKPIDTLFGVARAFLRYGSPRILTAQFFVALVVRCFLPAPSLRDAVVVLAVVVYWPLQEWFLHWGVLHAKPRRIGSRMFDSRAAKKHRDHHERPHVLGTALLPTPTILLLVVVHLVFWRLVAPTAAVGCTGVIALGGAALLYEWIHFSTHTAYKPKTRYFRTVRINHLMHHFRNEGHWYSFTLPALDDWLGTGGAPKNVPQSETCKTLGVRRPA
jgi:hypothetical protein